MFKQWFLPLNKLLGNRLGILIRIATPFIFMFVLVISVGLSFFLLGPFSALIFMLGVFASGFVNLAIIATFVGFALFSLASISMKSSWIEVGSTLRSHFWRCIALYAFGAISAVSIIDFSFPSYRNPGIGGAWVTIILFSSLAGIVADIIFISAARNRVCEST